MQVFQTNTFKQNVKKLHANKKACLDDAIRIILADPIIGIKKIGDLSGIRVYKFRIFDQLTILAYRYNEQDSSIILIALGLHENFYRNLKTSQS